MQTLLVCDAGVEKSLAKFLRCYRIGATEQFQKSPHPRLDENDSHLSLHLHLGRFASQLKFCYNRLQYKAQIRVNPNGVGRNFDDNLVFGYEMNAD